MRLNRLLLVLAITTLTIAASAQKTTTGTYSTWDADMINIENVSQTGKGVYVAVLDTGLVPNWRDYFPTDRIATNLGTGFDQSVTFKAHSPNGCEFDVLKGVLRQTTWVGSTTSTHGTHVTSTIIGFNYQSPTDAAAGYAIPPIYVRGIAPDVTIIPVKVLADYTLPAMPQCPEATASQRVNFGTDEMVAAGIRYATSLAKKGYRPMVVNMSLGGSGLAQVEKDAIDDAVANGVVLVAAAGNEGEAGMGYPGAYAPIISAGSVGWTKEWLKPTDGQPFYRMWWLQYPTAPILPGSGDVAEGNNVINDTYVSDFSSRALPGQQLDVLAPGSWVRGPLPGTPGYRHMPWWAKGGGPSNFFYVGGTSMATPHVSGVSALLLEKNPALTATNIQSILTSTALALPSVDSKTVYDLNTGKFQTISWDTKCGTNNVTCDPVGAGLVQADAAVGAAGAARTRK